MKAGTKDALLWGVGVGFMSAAALGLEIALANVFGVLLQYHYVSFIVSLAIFGIGAGAYASRKYGDPAGKGTQSSAWICLAAGVYIALLSVFLAKFPYANQMALYALLAAVPFGLFGWVTGKALNAGAMKASAVYASDLLGAGVGVVGAYALLYRLGGLGALFAMSAFAFAGAIVLFGLKDERIGNGGRKRRAGMAASSLLLGGSIILGIFAGPQSAWWKIDFAGLKGAAPDKTIVASLQSPGARIERTTWDPFARTDVVSTTDPTRKMVFVDGGAGSYIYKFDGNLNSMAGLAQDIEFLPFAAGPAEKAVVIGSGGGRDVLYTLLAGAKDVTAVELSEGIVRSMREDTAYNGGILDRPGVHTVVGDGRGVLERSSESFDLIVLDLVYSQVGGLNGQALSENYVFTKDAFETYVNRLKAGGRIIVVSHQGIEGVRAFYTGYSALMKEMNLTPAEAGSRVALIMAPEGSKSPNLTLSMIQKSPLTKDQLTLLQAGVQSLSLQPLFLPQTHEQLLKPLLDGKMPFDDFVRDSDFNVYPTTDDRPFFYQLQPGWPESMKSWLAVIAILTVLFAGWVWWMEVAPAATTGGSAGKPLNARIKVRLGPVAYFALLGIGYMCIQMTFIQKTVKFAGSPALAASVIIFAMLAGGGAGSRFAGVFRASERFALPAVILLAIVLTVASDQWGAALHRLDLAVRMTVIGLPVFMFGFAAGIPLPSRLEREELRQAGVSPFLFAVNGIAGIWGSWLGSCLALSGGLNGTLAGGCLCYFILAAAAWYKRRGVHHGNEAGTAA
ncbi:hypothetical protein [Cohnella candidum]|uniref:Spermidine synthase n=1 Tax=Cohnella candidum TaxID=2674991 RepID=A0A3G3K0H7_9BACL|nr:hypothetical protein [Cohnella candidum]AYQ73892.1 hypothetical protein EAV92_15685 [Cohnella candidum]